MDYIPIANGIGGEAIIWLIIAFLWVVAQLVNKAKEARAKQHVRQQSGSDRPVRFVDTAQESTPGTEEQQPRKTFDEEIRDFLESIGAEVEEEKPAPPPPPPPRRTRQQARITMKPAPAPVVPANVARDSNLGDISGGIHEADYETAYDLKEHSYEDVSIGTFVDPRSMLVDLSYMRMPLAFVPVTMMSTTDKSTSRPRLHSEGDLKRALKSQIILSTPLAMGEDKSTYTKRIA